MAFRLKSPAFPDGGTIPRRYSAAGAGVSPPLDWSGAPPETRELALLCEDPDAPTPHPFVHWIAYGISANTSRLPEGLAATEELMLPTPIRQGLNSGLQPGYTGPNPPFWHHGHRYRFRLFALNAPLPLAPGAGREEFLKALQGHVIAEALLTGTYEKPASQRARAAAAWASGAAALALLAVVARRTRSRRSGAARPSGREAAMELA